MSGQSCPECRNGKHANCTGWAIEPDTDDIVTCDCPTCRESDALRSDGGDRG